jgi:hypothetical protein
VSSVDDAVIIGLYAKSNANKDAWHVWCGFALRGNIVIL